MSDFDPETEALRLKVLTWKAQAERAQARITELEAALDASRARERKLATRATNAMKLADRLTTHVEGRDAHVERLVQQAIDSALASPPKRNTEPPAAVEPTTSDEPTEPYRARKPKKQKLDPDARYNMLCQMAARARCARKNLSPSARRRMVEQAKELNALPDADE